LEKITMSLFCCVFFFQVIALLHSNMADPALISTHMLLPLNPNDLLSMPLPHITDDLDDVETESLSNTDPSTNSAMNLATTNNENDLVDVVGTSKDQSFSSSTLFTPSFDSTSALTTLTSATLSNQTLEDEEEEDDDDEEDEKDEETDGEKTKTANTKSTAPVRLSVEEAFALIPSQSKKKPGRKPLTEEQKAHNKRMRESGDFVTKPRKKHRKLNKKELETVVSELDIDLRSDVEHAMNKVRLLKQMPNPSVAPTSFSSAASSASSLKVNIPVSPDIHRSDTPTPKHYSNTTPSPISTLPPFTHDTALYDLFYPLSSSVDSITAFHHQYVAPKNLQTFAQPFIRIGQHMKQFHDQLLLLPYLTEYGNKMWTEKKYDENCRSECREHKQWTLEEKNQCVYKHLNLMMTAWHKQLLYQWNLYQKDVVDTLDKHKTTQMAKFAIHFTSPATPTAATAGQEKKKQFKSPVCAKKKDLSPTISSAPLTPSSNSMFASANTSPVTSLVTAAAITAAATLSPTAIPFAQLQKRRMVFQKLQQQTINNNNSMIAVH
jgi:hypothetical protein